MGLDLLQTWWFKPTCDGTVSVGAMPAQPPAITGSRTDQCMILQVEQDELPQSEKDVVVIYRTYG